MNGHASRVEYTVSAFKRAGFVDGGRLMLLVPTGDSVDSLDAFRDTIVSLVDPWTELEADELWIRVRSPSVGPDGPLAYVEESEPGRALSRMLEDVARGLEQRGVSGRLKPAPSASSPYFGSLTFPSWNAAMRLSAPVGSQEPSLDWRTDLDVARAALSPLIEWMLDTDGLVYVSNGANFSVPSGEALDILLDSVTRDNRVWMERTDDHRRRREISTSSGGWVSLVHYDVDRPRLELLDELAGVLESVASWVNFGFVRDRVSHGGDEMAMLSRTGDPAPIAGGDDWNAFDWSIPLEADFVYDANVHQVVSTSQLAKMRLNPQTWIVRDLGRERHAVRHLEPEAWFDPIPYPLGSRGTAINTVVLASAREDFGDAILGREVVLKSQPLADPEQEARRRRAIDPIPAAAASPRPRPRQEVRNNDRRWWEGHALPTLSAVLLLPVDLDSLYDWPGFGHNYAWHVKDEVARAALEPALEWVLATDGPVSINHSRDLVPPKRAIDLFHERLSDRPNDLHARTHDRPQLERSPHDGSFRRVSVLDYGMAVVHSYDATRTKLEQLEDLVAILTAAAPHLAAGFVREVPTWSHWRHDVLINQKPIAPYGPRRGQKPWDYARFQNSAHLESEFVYDAFVAQVMTLQQFARTQLDPTRWEVTELGHQGFAVQARTPTQWFDHDPRPLDCRAQRRGDMYQVLARRPSPVARKVLEAARRDFDDAIMTARNLATHPPHLPARHREQLERAMGLALGSG